MVRPLRVVVVDDEPLSRLALRSALERPDVVVVGEAADGAEALTLVARLHPDVVVLDVRMPVLDGPSAAREIARQWPEVAVLLCSSDAQSDLPAPLPAPFVAKELVTADLVRSARDA